MVPFISLEYDKGLIVALTQKELKRRYKRSFPGYLRSIANPLALAAVFCVAIKGNYEDSNRKFYVVFNLGTISLAVVLNFGQQFCYGRALRQIFAVSLFFLSTCWARFY